MFFTNIRDRVKSFYSRIIFSPEVGRRSDAFSHMQHTKLLYGGWFHSTRPQRDILSAAFSYNPLTYSHLQSKQTFDGFMNHFTLFSI